MKDTVCYKLHFNAPLHIGCRWEGYEDIEETLHSDTIFSAVMSAISLLFDDHIEPMCKEPPFITSSAFPFVGVRFFFPRPMLNIMDSGKDEDFDPTLAKKLGKARYVEKSLFEQIIKGVKFRAGDIAVSNDGRFLIAGGNEEDIHFCHIREVPRNVKDRVTDATTIFYFSQMSFAKGAGFFFLVRFIDTGMRPKIEASLRLLGDEGIGGDRSTGKGTFTIETDGNFHLEVPENMNRFLTLSLYHPAKEEVDNGILGSTAYRLVERGGWVTAPGMRSFRKGNVRMFAEGSVFTGSPGLEYGDVPVLLPKNEQLGIRHNIYRMGRAFPVPCCADGGAS